MARVVLENVSKHYPAAGDQLPNAVHQINLEIRDREFLVLVGPSGCGKTTLLRMIAGLEEVSEGTIYLDDRDITRVAPGERDIAMVFQNYALYPHLSVFDNLAFGLKMRKLPRAEIRDRIRETAAVLGLDGFLDRLPKTLSGGQRQRVALGRAIVRQPKAFLFDEPLSNLDARMRVQMRAELARLHERLKTTMIYVTHDQAEAMTLGERIVVLSQGTIQQIADPVTLYREPGNLFVAGFVGSPAMNLVTGTLSDENGRYLFTEKTGPGCLGFKLMLEIPEGGDGRVKSEVILGVRPEHVVLGSGDLLPGGRVELVERMGSESFVHIRTGGHVIVARSGADRLPALGGECRFELQRGWSFDPATGGRRWAWNDLRS